MGLPSLLRRVSSLNANVYTDLVVHPLPVVGVAYPKPPGLLSRRGVDFTLPFLTVRRRLFVVSTVGPSRRNTGRPKSRTVGTDPIVSDVRLLTPSTPPRGSTPGTRHPVPEEDVDDESEEGLKEGPGTLIERHYPSPETGSVGGGVGRDSRTPTPSSDRGPTRSRPDPTLGSEGVGR